MITFSIKVEFKNALKTNICHQLMCSIAISMTKVGGVALASRIL